MSDISEMVIPHVMILTNAKSLVQITVVSTLPVETLLAALNVLVSMDILVMVLNAPNWTTEQFSTRVPVSGYAPQDMPVQCIAVKISMNV
jgi:hypothetical protein